MMSRHRADAAAPSTATSGGAEDGYPGGRRTRSRTSREMKNEDDACRVCHNSGGFLEDHDACPKPVPACEQECTDRICRFGCSRMFLPLLTFCWRLKA